ncbi:hypothetical protein A3F07_01030 [candidate division WWE3 bacterium RIFCSPHIGHO2_12_FULL_38_15]|uniref:Cell division protein FtsL n=1 Tax=candidate division WWE3 bacterium RIFCSPHIGHO2_02_FULL_38_14 TaxID=1802620 RepID=A0A1F4VA48_UNCKA|nr:MAG: hypothetical protein A2793_03770 [candidate division WWE3 bacterium RIFCSPHIGHO2_01_FULL_38_45]OGC49158.1 MAG: hypothetical protein A3F07_01030 [candidate division WWE3 bacterium RIFCSPHIGHO2_12_FULL_38_15]OGC52576.1 MAG: hypothetical protein A3B64_03375 [candidate division WWE3 bacterium RIFCSPLOWO2_01_FULL_37_24]OGC54067.1 MAG: hypothetical protein A3D91_04900 [candidate division WWE3 bacterium RIFCSPHIGHO2_02_FULL_38_14]HLB51761.1 hypothetical protein [Patescibacteria group bacterium
MVKLPKKSIAKTTLIINIILFIISLIFQLVVSNATGLKGEELAALEKGKTQLQKEISELEYQSYNLSSLVLIEKKANEQGFEKIKEAIAALPKLSDSQVAVVTTY